MPLTDERLTEIARDAIKGAVENLTGYTGLSDALWDEEISEMDIEDECARLEAAIRHEARYADGTPVLSPADDQV